MKITDLRTTIVDVPLERPLHAAIARLDRIPLVLVVLPGEGGIWGQSYIYAFTMGKARAVKALIEDLRDLVVGQDSDFALGLWERLEYRIALAGYRGIAQFALSAIDIAVWDLRCKELGRPLYKVLGARRDRVPAYASEGLFLTEKPDALAYEAQELVAKGFRAVKMRVGRSDPAADLAAVEAVRSAIGPDIALMVDINQGWTADRAIRWGRRFEESDIYWLEEPVRYDDLEGHARIAAALDVPIASAENAYTLRGVRDYIEARAADILMPDLQRIGGVTGWLHVAGLAAAHGVPLSPHLFPEVGVHLVAASPTGLLQEHMPWADAILKDPLQVRDGEILVSDKPGVGIELDRAAVAKYAVD
ncbi:MAG TPA: mandelate racemase/muconate lactonizing enzyme family protein [Dehalococcoidia bacterium]|nr:mandelate racemase/muconate lactonizing enzyme family protein [Dehalococcoidia bacterium]